jgi:hypothetical protein
MRVREDSVGRYTFGYIDESGTSSRYFACGLLIHGPHISGIEDNILNQQLRNLKTECGICTTGDIAWKKVPTKPGQYFDLYRSFLQGFFRHPNLSFNALVVDTHQYPLDSQIFFRGSKDLGIDSFSFHLVRSRILRFWKGDERLYLRFDRRQRPTNLTLRNLAFRLRTILPQTDTLSPRITTRSINGARHPLVQITDLLLGCVTSSLNKQTQSVTKLQLIHELGDLIGFDPGQSTDPSCAKFNVWHFEAN